MHFAITYFQSFKKQIGIKVYRERESGQRPNLWNAQMAILDSIIALKGANYCHAILRGITFGKRTFHLIICLFFNVLFFYFNFQQKLISHMKFCSPKKNFQISIRFHNIEKKKGVAHIDNDNLLNYMLLQTYNLFKEKTK